MTTIANTRDAAAQAKARMEKAVEDFRKELAGLRSGRANVALLDHIRVDYHGTVTPIDKAIRTSDLGLNPTSDGKVIRVPIPPLTEERRKDLVEHLHKVLENHRTAVRNIRRDIKEAVEKLEKEKKISEDERKRSLEELEKLTHQETKKLEDLSAAKEKEILELK